MSSQFPRCLFPLTALCSATVFYVILYCSTYTLTEDRATEDRTRQSPFSSSNTIPGDSAVWKKSVRLTNEEISTRFSQRQRLLQNACRRHSKSPVFNHLKIENFQSLPLYWPVMKNIVGFCPIQKAASSTLWRLFRHIRKEMTFRGMSGTSVYKPNGKKDVQVLTDAKDVQIVFVREPYGRLLSAFVDKLFSPNEEFWRSTGVYIVDRFRYNASRKSLKCGHDITFREFIKFFIHMQTTGEKRDGHFVPTHDHCEMCVRPYKYIGHVETISQDLPYILQAIQCPVIYNETYTIQTIKSDSNMVLNTMRKAVGRCMNLDEACRRLWKKWQVRGLISKRTEFPLTEEETRNISLRHFQKIAIANLGSGDFSQRELLRAQKTEALREAFASVSLEDRKTVKNLLFLDFEMFGFVATPDAVFPKKPYKNDSGFSYFNI